jgi:hypothetical protein
MASTEPPATASILCEAEDFSQLLTSMPTSKEPDWSSLNPVDKPTISDWKRVWLQDRPNLLGDLAHYYLSFIIRNLSDEHDYAFRRCLLRYGSLLQREDIMAIVDICHQSCNKNPWLFESTWDLVFTEFEIKGSKGLLRIDRLMLNTNAKQALIVDYKSGQIHDALQLEDYRSALLKLNNLTAYDIDLRFLKLQ